MYKFFIFLFLYLTLLPLIFQSHAQYPTYSILGNVFVDNDGDNIYDAGETVLHQNTILFTITTTPNYPVTYTAGWSYQVHLLPPGTYNVSLTGIPAGYVSSYPAGTPPFYSVSVGPSCSTDTSHGSFCKPRGDIENLNFAVRNIYTISGNVFYDTNRNGIKDNGEPGYGSGVVDLTGSATGQKISGPLGNYSFPNLFGGNYTVTLTVPSGYVPTTPNPPTSSTTLP